MIQEETRTRVDGIRRWALLVATVAIPWLACNDTGAGGGLQPTEFTLRVSVGAEGEEANGASSNPSISDDGQFVAFASGATNLVPQDSDGVQDVFVKDRVTGAVSNVSFITPLASYPLAGPPVRGNSSAPAISGDGQTVAFLSVGDLLPVPFSTLGSPYYPPAIHSTTNVFVYSFSTHGLSRVLQRVTGFMAWPTADVTDLSLSANGRYLAFATGDTNMHFYTQFAVPAGSIQIYVADLTTGQISVASPSISTAMSGCNSICAHPQISSDGLSVVFDSNASDVAGITGPFTQVYLASTAGGATSIVSTVAISGSAGAYNAWFPRVSANGRYVTFLTDAPPTIRINSTSATLMIRDLQLSTNTVVAQNPYVQPIPGISLYPTNGEGSWISSDGRFVLFKSADNTLTPIPFSVPQIFLWDLQAGISLASINTLTGSAASSECFNAVLSRDGSWAAWDTTANNLIGIDNNGASDVFVRGPLR